MLDMGGRSVKRRQQIEKCLQREAAEHLEHDRLGGNASKCQHHESPQSWKVVGIIPQLPYFRLSLMMPCCAAASRTPSTRAASSSLSGAAMVIVIAYWNSRSAPAARSRRSAAAASMPCCASTSRLV